MGELIPAHHHHFAHTGYMNGVRTYECDECGAFMTDGPMPDTEWEQKRRERISPDCRDGKHRACIGDAWDDEADALADCECICHEEGN